MKSLHKIVKQPKLIKHSEIVRLADHQVPTVEIPQVEECVTADNSSELLVKKLEEESIKAEALLAEAKEKAKEIIALAKRKAEWLEAEQKRTWEEQLPMLQQQVRVQTRQDMQTEITNSLQRAIQQLDEDVRETLQSVCIDLHQQQSQVANQAHKLSVAIAEKIVQEKIETGFDIESLIEKEVKKMKNSKVQRVCIDTRWEGITTSLQENLAALNIALEYEDQTSDYILIESEMGQYDISLNTQLENVRRLFDM